MMTPAPPANSTSLGLLFRQVRDAMWNAMDAELRAMGHELTFSQFITIKRLGLGCSDLGVSELARAAELNPGAMTRLLDRLEEKGLIVRESDPQDRRALHIRLTASGHAIHADSLICSDRVRDRALVGMSEAERQQFVALLEQVRDNLTSPERS